MYAFGGRGDSILLTRDMMNYLNSGLGSNYRNGGE